MEGEKRDTTGEGTELGRGVWEEKLKNEKVLNAFANILICCQGDKNAFWRNCLTNECGRILNLFWNN